MRLGNQVLSWGESTFIQNGVNIVNPVDVTMLRSPGAELRDALIPVPMASGSFDVTKEVSVGAFYQFSFRATEIDPPGTYFSTSDIVGDGGETLWLGPEGIYGAGIPRNNREARDSGQYGVALHIFAPPLNDAEFGIFYVNYHSRLLDIRRETTTLTHIRRIQYSSPLTAQIWTPVRTNCLPATLPFRRNTLLSG